MDEGIDAFDLRGRLGGASGGQGRIVALQMLVGGIADKDATATGEGFEAAGQIYLPAKDGVIALANDLLDPRTHQPDRRRAGIDAGSQQQNGQHRKRIEAGRDARGILALALLVFGGALAVQFGNAALRVDGSANTSRGMPRLGFRIAPEGHHAVADELVPGAVVSEHRIGNQSQVQVDGRNSLAGLFIKVGLSSRAGEMVRAHEFVGLLLDGIGEFREAADIREEDGDFAPGADQGELLGLEQYVGDLGGDDGGQDGPNTAAFGLFEYGAPSDDGRVIHQHRTADG